MILHQVSRETGVIEELSSLWTMVKFKTKIAAYPQCTVAM